MVLILSNIYSRSSLNTFSMSWFLYSSLKELPCSPLSLVWPRYSSAIEQVAATRNITSNHLYNVCVTQNAVYLRI